MCVIDKRKFRFTLWRKKCYKVLSKKWFDTEKDAYYTPHQNAKVFVSETEETELIPEDPSINPILIGKSRKYIFEPGFIFYFTDLDRAKEYANYVDSGQGHIFEGYIPAFTRYAKNCEDPEEGCARKIVLTKRIA